jgi:hypothetical protein
MPQHENIKRTIVLIELISDQSSTKEHIFCYYFKFRFFLQILVWRRCLPSYYILCGTMVALDYVQASNDSLASYFGNDNFTAVFPGGTSGIGEITLLEVARKVARPRIYIVGRSETSAARIIDEAKQINKDGYYEFVKADLMLLKNIDDVCDQIKQKEEKINLLFMTQMMIDFGGRKGMSCSPYYSNIVLMR